MVDMQCSPVEGNIVVAALAHPSIARLTDERCVVLGVASTCK